MESAKKTNIAGSKAKSRSVEKTSEEKKRYINIKSAKGQRAAKNQVFIKLLTLRKSYLKYLI